MANNRMYLLHRPSGLAAYLGKHMGAGWYTSKGTRKRVEALFDRAWDWSVDNGVEGINEDFCVAMESCDAVDALVDTDFDGCEDAGGGLVRLREPKPREMGLPDTSSIHGAWEQHMARMDAMGPTPHEDPALLDTPSTDARLP